MCIQTVSIKHPEAENATPALPVARTERQLREAALALERERKRHRDCPCGYLGH
jgi:hypothetical protein